MDDNRTATGKEWSADELKVLTKFIPTMTIAQIANKLNRPYSDVAIQVSRLGLNERAAKQPKKIPRNGDYTKEKVLGYLKDIVAKDIKVTKFAKENNLGVETLIAAIQKFDSGWYESYCEKNAVKPKTKCPYCEQDFYPLSHNQTYCDKRCGDQARIDKSYFGGKRRETIGLIEGICQLCGARNPKGLSSHHMLGKENDPDNEHLIALCQGCHQIVTIIATRKFVDVEESWEVLIQLALTRRNGDNPSFRGVQTLVELDVVTGNEV